MLHGARYSRRDAVDSAADETSLKAMMANRYAAISSVLRGFSPAGAC
jgi:hypothetical protein